MRKKAKPILIAVCAGMLTSCIGDEPLNAECDIESVSIMVDDPGQLFYNPADTEKGYGPEINVSSTATEIVYIVRALQMVGELPITLKVTEGAEIELKELQGDYKAFKNGSPVDFTGGMKRLFRIKSQDGAWERNYEIYFKQRFAQLGPCSLEITFDNYALNDPNKTVESAGAYYVWTAEDPNAISKDQWVCGNPGFKLSKSSAKPNDYPTVAVAGEGVDGGACLKLETRDTGAFGRMANMRIAAGNFFIGTFDVANAMKDALAATRFGLPFSHKPVKMTGYYKFKAGEQFQDKKGNPVDRIDLPDAYCILYRNTNAEGKQVLLDGADVLTNPNIVGLGRITDVIQTDEWTPFEIPVIYSEEVDDEVLVDFGYNMTICFSSSIEGAYFEGAPGSVFYIDNVTLECEY